MSDEHDNEHEVDTGPDEASQKKRPTVDVYCAVPIGLQMRRHSPAVHQFAPQLPTGEGVILKPGSNPGIDKEWFDGWLEENQELSVVKSGMIVAHDEKDPDDEDTVDQPE